MLHRFLLALFTGLGLVAFRGLPNESIPVFYRPQPHFAITSNLGPDQPNIIWLSCEDMSPHLGCYGDSTIPTPNIDRLAREGVRFTNAYTTAGVCAPSRNAIITGMYQTATGGHNMRTIGNTFPEQTGLPKEYSVVMPSYVKAFPEFLRATGYYCTNNAKTDYQFEAPPTVWDEVGNKATYQKRANGQPFFAVFNNVITHESQVWVRKDLPLRADPDRIKVPPYYPDTKTVRNDMARFFSNIREMDDWVGKMIAQLEEEGLLEKTIIFFWSDHGDGLPFVKREILHRGLHVPLIVRFPDKRLAGTTRNDLVSMIDLAPTVLSLAGIKPPEYMHGQPFFGKHTASKPRGYVFAARDRMDEAYERVRTVHDGQYQYVRNYFPEKPHYQNITFRKQQPMMVEMLRLHGEGKLSPVQSQWFKPTKATEEFYDLKADPFELKNLASDPNYSAQFKRLKQAFEKWQKTVPDLGATPEKELIQTWWKGQNTPPVTADPVVSRLANKLKIECPTEGASIGYRLLGKGKNWNVYTVPLETSPGQTVEVIAQRIGYGASQITTYKM